MKRYLDSFVVGVFVSMLVAVPLASARMGGFGGFGGGFGGRQRFGRSYYYHDYGHYGFYFGWPLAWYPYYWGPYYYSGCGYYYSPQYDYYNQYTPAPAYSYGDNTQGYAHPEYDRRDYLTLGHDSGKALKLQKVSREWLVDYLRAYVINAPSSVRDDFRRGFISGYGEGAESVLEKAMHDVQQPNPPLPSRTGTMPRSESTPSEKPE